jgi:hypothetical protein
MIDYATLMLSLAPEAYWRLDEGAGVAPVDKVSGYSLIGTGGTRNYPGLLAGDPNPSILCNGTVAYSDADAKWALGSGDFSFSTIILFTYTALASAFCIRVNSGSVLFVVTTSRFSAGDICCETWSWSDAGTRVRSQPLNNGLPHHVIVSYENASKLLRLYIDGILIDTRLQTGTRTSAFSPQLVIGNNLGAVQPYIGVQDEIALWKRVVTGEEAARLHTVASRGPMMRARPTLRRSRSLVV